MVPTLMRFSIVIPVFNNPSDLSNCLASIARLRVPEGGVEVIVVDNNSTDDTAGIARSFGATVLVERDFQSSYAARNRGIRAARGEFIAFTDSDCIVDEHWLTEIEAAAQDGVGCLAGEILSASPATLIERFSDEIGLLRQRGPLSGWHFKPYAQTANAVYRRRVFDEIGLFDPSMQSGGDAAIAWRMQDETAYTLKFVPSAIVYHHHRTSVPELWKQFRRYGTGKMSWARAQPDYTPPAIAGLEAEAVTALEKAVAALESAGLDEKELVFPVLRAATQMAHLSGYMQDLLTTLAQDLPLDQIPGHARKLVPTCNLCGSTRFVPGPGDRMTGRRAPQCDECGSLERHRALGRFLDMWKPEDIARRSVISFGEALPEGIAKRFRAARRAHIGERLDGGHDIVVAPTFAALAQGRELAETLGHLVSPLADDGALILIDRKDTSIDVLAGGENAKSTIDDRFRLLVAEHLPNAAVQAKALGDDVTSDQFFFIHAST